MEVFPFLLMLLFFSIRLTNNQKYLLRKPIAPIQYTLRAVTSVNVAGLPTGVTLQLLEMW